MMNSSYDAHLQLCPATTPVPMMVRFNSQSIPRLWDARLDTTDAPNAARGPTTEYVLLFFQILTARVPMTLLSPAHPRSPSTKHIVIPIV
jgi:hypothetical protein